MPALVSDGFYHHSGPSKRLSKYRSSFEELHFTMKTLITDMKSRIATPNKSLYKIPPCNTNYKEGVVLRLQV